MNKVIAIVGATAVTLTILASSHASAGKFDDPRYWDTRKADICEREWQAFGEYAYSMRCGTYREAFFTACKRRLDRTKRTAGLTYWLQRRFGCIRPKRR